MGQATQVGSIVVMGVSGSGKSRIGRLLAERIGSVFSEGDRLHSAGNIAKMSAGHALNDEERLPWLRAVGEQLERAEAGHQRSVVACSALKRTYRDILREHVADILFVFLDGPFEVVHERMVARHHEFMPPSLLLSQFASLERLEDDERGIEADIQLEPEQVVRHIEDELKRLSAQTELKKLVFRNLKGQPPMQGSKYGKLDVSTASSNDELGAVAAAAFAAAVGSALKAKDEIAVILATGNSQLSFARAVRERDDIDWSRVTILHMDEYLGMTEDHPASFRRWMKENIVQHVSPKAFEGVQGEREPIEEELERYTELVRELDPAICVMGIGENGHLAFNDPPADFETEDLIRVVDLDEACRNQQVGEGHFASLEETPKQALSLTVHALLRAGTVLVLTPEARKARAVKAALEGPVTASCPASILQTQPQARLYLDQESSSLLDRDRP